LRAFCSMRVNYMKISLIGYGKMGHIIEDIALQRGHQIVCTLDKDTCPDVWESPSFLESDVAIEFSEPSAAEDNIRKALSHGIPVVSGTTGWTMPEDLKVAQEQGKLVWKSNFSIGVNVLFALNRQLAEMLAPYTGYQPKIEEIHHVHKLDKPSGTAKTLGEDIQRACGKVVEIDSIREGEVPGTHTVTWDSEEDTIVIQHIAKGRRGFALGAVIEAEKLVGLQKS